MPTIEAEFGILSFLMFCNGMLSWMIRIWKEKREPLLSDNNCNNVNLERPNNFTSNDRQW